MIWKILTFLTILAFSVDSAVNDSCNTVRETKCSFYLQIAEKFMREGHDHLIICPPFNNCTEQEKRACSNVTEDVIRTVSKSCANSSIVEVPNGATIYPQCENEEGVKCTKGMIHAFAGLYGNTSIWRQCILLKDCTDEQKRCVNFMSTVNIKEIKDECSKFSVPTTSAIPQPIPTSRPWWRTLF